MAYEEDVFDVSFLAGEDLSAAQYHFVELSANNTVKLITHATTGNPIGILQNAPSAAGQVARVRIQGVSRVYTGTAGITFGVFVGSDASGHGIDKSTNTHKYCGVALASSATTETGTVLLFGMRSISV